MRLLSARIRDFRNIESAELELAPRFTALIGGNGQGKTNALEALYLISALRPLRNVPRSALFRNGTTNARVEVAVERDATGLRHDLAIELKGNSRVVEKDQKRTDTAHFLGTAVAVAFTPDDLSLGKGSPEGRRRFLDRALLNVRPSYLTRALRFQKAVKDRNRVLVEQGSDQVLDAYDQVIALEGAAIMVDRARYVRELAPLALEHFRRIADPAPPLSLRYAPSFEEGLDPESEEKTRVAYLEKLGRRRVVDRQRRSTTVGPHHDDLELDLEGERVKDRASQGQHRAIALALKIAELIDLAGRLGEAPVLLLDDMSSELDPVRSRQLFDSVRRLEGQVILTGTEPPKSLELGSELVEYEVMGGRFTRRQSP
jgi:DNA replication and repair protein RecF